MCIRDSFELLRSGPFKREIEGNEEFYFIPHLAENLTGEPLILALMIVLYVGTQLIASVITMVGGDKTQQRIMFALPFVFTIFIINFEAGLIVYWITTNVWTIGQQLVVRKLYPKPQVLAETGHAADDADADNGGKPARGKPAAAGASGDAGNGAAAAKPPPGSPRKKKKRSGRRR